jgi:hypothetical protein
VLVVSAGGKAWGLIVTPPAWDVVDPVFGIPTVIVLHLAVVAEAAIIAFVVSHWSRNLGRGLLGILWLCSVLAVYRGIAASVETPAQVRGCGCLGLTEVVSAEVEDRLAGALLYTMLAAASLGFATERSCRLNSRSYTPSYPIASESAEDVG